MLGEAYARVVSARLSAQAIRSVTPSGTSAISQRMPCVLVGCSRTPVIAAYIRLFCTAGLCT